MTDLEITKLCAEAMDLPVLNEVKDQTGEYLRCRGGEQGGFYKIDYDPLHDDAQAMALVKKFALKIIPDAGIWDAGTEQIGWGCDTNLNRAICECVANMQATSAHQSKSAGKPKAA